jgi:hypothetical protein
MPTSFAARKPKPFVAARATPPRVIVRNPERPIPGPYLHSGPSDPHPASRARGGVPDADAGREMRCSSGSHPRTTRDIRRAFTAAAARIQPPPPSPPKSPRSSHSPPPSPTTGNCHRYLFRPRSAQASRSSVAEQRSVGAALQIRARRHADLRSPDGERTECRHCSRPRASSRELFRWGGDRV